MTLKEVINILNKEIGLKINESSIDKTLKLKILDDIEEKFKKEGEKINIKYFDLISDPSNSRFYPFRQFIKILGPNKLLMAYEIEEGYFHNDSSSSIEEIIVIKRQDLMELIKKIIFNHIMDNRNKRKEEDEECPWKSIFKNYDEMHYAEKWEDVDISEASPEEIKEMIDDIIDTVGIDKIFNEMEEIIEDFKPTNGYVNLNKADVFINNGIEDYIYFGLDLSKILF